MSTGTPTRSNPEVITAVPTAFAADGAVDRDASREILEFVAASGNEGAFVLGTTGEFPSLSIAERNELAELAVETLQERMRVIVHVGAASLHEVLQLIDGARAAGAKEIAVLTPHYLPVAEGALLEFFKQVDAASAGLRAYVYVYQKRANNFVTPELMREIAALPSFVGAKVSEEPLELLGQYRDVVPEDFAIYTGADRDLLRVADHGAQGVVSGVSSTLPRPFRAAADEAATADAARLDELQRDIDIAVDAIAGDMERMRAGLRLQGVAAGVSRMAIAKPDAVAAAEIEAAVARLG